MLWYSETYMWISDQPPSWEFVSKIILLFTIFEINVPAALLGRNAAGPIDTSKRGCHVKSNKRDKLSSNEHRQMDLNIKVI